MLIRQTSQLVADKISLDSLEVMSDLIQQTISDRKQTVWCMHVYLLVGTVDSLSSSHLCTNANLPDEKAKLLGSQLTFQIKGLS